MRSLSRVTLVSLTCLFSAIGTVAGGDLTSAAPAGARLALTGISPTAGPLAGGNEVTIRADGAADVTSVDFGATSGGTITHVDADLLRVVAPAHDAGQVDVVLHSDAATSVVSPAGEYRFVPTPQPFPLEMSQRLGTDHVIGALGVIGCTTHQFCAVQMTDGYTYTTALITFGKGQPRRIQHLPHPAYVNFLIACGNPTFCVAGDRRGVRVWNGHRWGGPTRLGSGKDRVLSCAPGTTRCVLGGDHDSYVHGRHGWRRVGFPRDLHYATSLSCATARFCLAVMKDGQTARFDGRSWQAGTARHVPANIACASAHYCLAVGRRHAARFDGAAWHAVAAPPSRVDIIAASCVAVGQCVVSTRRFTETFAHGRWTQSQETTAARSIVPGRLELAGLACVPHGICRATTNRGLILRLEHGHWAGAHNVTAYHNRLSDISCASPTWCLAVGLSGEAFRYSDGQWSREGDVDGRHPLVAISCTADKVCVAVDAATGTRSSGVLSGGRAVRYSHGHWHRPVVVDTGHEITDVSCATAGYCVAVERAGRAITFRHGKWSEPVSLKQRVRQGVRFTVSVSCPTIHYCATAGYPGSFELIDGTWRRIDADDLAPYRALDYARGVDCVTSNYCVYNDGVAILIRNHGVVGFALGSYGATQVASCASRIYCVAVYRTETHEDYNTHTALLAGAAVHRDGRLSDGGKPGPPRAIACLAGPVCIGITDTQGFVGA